MKHVKPNYYIDQIATSPLRQIWHKLRVLFARQRRGGYLLLGLTFQVSLSHDMLYAHYGIRYECNCRFRCTHPWRYLKGCVMKQIIPSPPVPGRVYARAFAWPMRSEQILRGVTKRMLISVR